MQVDGVMQAVMEVIRVRTEFFGMLGRETRTQNLEEPREIKTESGSAISGKPRTGLKLDRRI